MHLDKLTNKVTTLDKLTGLRNLTIGVLLMAGVIKMIDSSVLEASPSSYDQLCQVLPRYGNSYSNVRSGDSMAAAKLGEVNNISPGITNLSHPPVSAEGYEWIQVQLADGTVGEIRKDVVRLLCGSEATTPISQPGAPLAINVGIIPYNEAKDANGQFVLADHSPGGEWIEVYQGDLNAAGQPYSIFMGGTNFWTNRPWDGPGAFIYQLNIGDSFILNGRSCTVISKLYSPSGDPKIFFGIVVAQLRGETGNIAVLTSTGVNSSSKTGINAVCEP